MASQRLVCERNEQIANNFDFLSLEYVCSIYENS